MTERRLPRQVGEECDDQVEDVRDIGQVENTAAVESVTDTTASLMAAVSGVPELRETLKLEQQARASRAVGAILR